MGLRLGSSINSKRNGPGFELKFTENRTYNLDELVELRNRTSSTAALVIEVKNEEAIAKRVLEKLIEDTTVNIITSLDERNAEFKTQIGKIIKDVYNKYQTGIVGTSNQQLKDKISTEISARVDKYLKYILDTQAVQFKVFAEDRTGETFTVVYDFSSREVFNEKFVTYYTKYANEYNSELTVGEGGLAISDSAVKIKVSKTDYEKYLLSENATPTQSNPSYIALSGSKPVVIWTDGTEPTGDDLENPQITDVIINYSTIKNSTIDGSCKVVNPGTDDNSIATVGYVNNFIKNASEFATVEYVDEEIDKVIGDAKESLDTLKELADAIGDDPDFVNTVTSLMNTKVDKDTFERNITEINNSIDDVETMIKEEVSDIENTLNNTYASKTFVNDEIKRLIGDAPELLDTLSESADAIGDDSEFITTINKKIVAKQNMIIVGDTKPENSIANDIWFDTSNEDNDVDAVESEHEVSTFSMRSTPKARQIGSEVPSKLIEDYEIIKEEVSIIDHPIIEQERLIIENNSSGSLIMDTNFVSDSFIMSEESLIMES